ncbi:MAG: hypothetical protein JWP89_7031 [Schlesneria sp.]|nr:hypothetical protein [Schlesneria sp.]
MTVSQTVISVRQPAISGCFYDFEGKLPSRGLKCVFEIMGTTYPPEISQIDRGDFLRNRLWVRCLFLPRRGYAESSGGSFSNECK